jgi:hypothetical protein
MTKVYIIGIEEDTGRYDRLLFSDDLTTINDELAEKIVSLVETNWIIADPEGGPKCGSFFLVDVVYDSEATFEEESALYLIQDTNVSNIAERIIKEVGSSFSKIKSLEKLPYNSI